MLVIGLTGGMGSGKSYIADLFKAKGIEIIDTDQIARQVVEPDQTAYKTIVEKFGTVILTDNGDLNRAKLRKIIFQDSEKRRWLEQLLHPLIFIEMERQIALAKSAYCIAVIPLLVETGSHPLINRILVVDATKTEQIERAAIRDQTSSEDIQAMLNSQTSRDERLAAADDVIQNHRIDELAAEVEKLHRFYLSLS